MLTIEKVELKTDKFMRSVDKYSRWMGALIVLLSIGYLIAPVFMTSDITLKEVFILGAAFGVIVMSVIFWTILRAGRSE